MRRLDNAILAFIWFALANIAIVCAPKPNPSPAEIKAARLDSIRTACIESGGQQINGICGY